MQIKANIPILQQREIWQRNQQYKHWGCYKVFRFVNGEPTYLISSYSSLTLIFSFILFFSFILLLGITKSATPLTAIRFCLIIAQIYFSYLFYKTNPGIASHSLPIINQLELIRYKSFCVKCKCMQNDQIKHCQLCDVCIQNQYLHSNILKACISSRNVKNFCILWGCIFFSSLLYVFQ